MSQRPPGSWKNVCKIALAPTRRLLLERLEPRALLATDLGEIRGVVFIDRLSDGLTIDDQLVSAATIELFLDDGDGLFEPGGDDLLQSAAATDNAGGYAFQRLSAGDYWVSQPAQTVAGRPLPAQQNFLTISALEAQGDVGLLVDSFDTAAPLSIAANGSTGANNANTAVVTGGEVLGDERDFALSLLAPDTPLIGQAQMGIAGGNLSLFADNTARAQYLVTWDGLDNDGFLINPVGLRGGNPAGVDLTTNGTKNAFLLEDLTATLSGGPGNATVGQLRIAVVTSAGNFSQLTIPVQEGLQQDLLLNFSDFVIGSGTGADFTNVGAIQLEFVSGAPAVALQLANVQTAAPSVSSANFAAPGTSDLSLLKSVDNATPNVGDNVTFTITVNNAGPDAVSGVEVTDFLPAGLTFVSSLPSQGVYDSATGLWTVDSISNGGQAVLVIVASVDAAGVLVNEAEITAADIFDPDSIPNNGDPSEDDQAQATLNSLGPQAVDLELSNTADQPNANVQEQVVFTITLVNNSALLASGLVVDALLPAEFAFIAANPSQGVYNTANGVWTVGSLFGSGLPALATLQITAQVIQPGQLSFTAELAAADQPDSDSIPGNGDPTEDDFATADVIALSPAVDLAVAVSASALSPSVNQDLTLTFTVSNFNPQAPTDAQAVVVAIQLPPEFIAQGAAGPSQGGFAFNSNNGGTWTLGTLPFMATVTLELMVQAILPGVFTASAQVSSGSPDNNPDNDLAVVEIQAILIPIPPEPPEPPTVFITAQFRQSTRLEPATLPFVVFAPADSITIVSAAAAQPITTSNGWEPPFFPWIRDYLAREDATAQRAEQAVAENERQNRKQALARRLGGVEEADDALLGESNLSSELSALLLQLAAQGNLPAAPATRLLSTTLPNPPPTAANEESPPRSAPMTSPAPSRLVQPPAEMVNGSSTGSAGVINDPSVRPANLQKDPSREVSP